VRFEKTTFLVSTTDLAYYNAGVIFVNSEIVGLAPGSQGRRRCFADPPRGFDSLQNAAMHTYRHIATCVRTALHKHSFEWLAALTATAWLPDGLFSLPKSKFGYIYEGLGMKNIGTFFDD
jgi:hypothetical protein